jgi:Lrp/AsnC family leucine-responsive transcriptional regulator
VSRLDRIDRKILDQLQANGKINNCDLADRVGLSPSPCLRRVRQLEEDRVITGYVAKVDPQALNLSITAFVRVRLEQQCAQHIAKFEREISALPEVMECYLMAGEIDYHLRILVASLTDFESFLRQKLAKMECVAHVTSSLALKPIICRTALPSLASS